MKKLTDTILCDIDGTIALRGERSPHDHEYSIEDTPNWPIIHIVTAFSIWYGYQVVLVSGREEKFREVTEYWLRTHRVFPSAPLIMRPAGDNRSDEVVKRELYEKYIAPEYKVIVVFDDRNRVVKMWRELGLTCLQVADGDF